MKLFLLIFILTTISFAQDVISVSRGSGSYVYTVTTGTDQIVSGDLYLYGNLTKTLTDTGTYSFRPYIVWKYTNGAYDSSIALRIGNSFLIRVEAPLIDTTGTYYASVLYKTKNNNWIYSRGVDSNFVTSTVAIDSIPDFTLTAITNASLDSAYTTSTVFSNANTSFNVWTTTAANFKIGASDTYSATMKSADNGDTLFVQNPTGSAYSQTYRETIVAAGNSKNFDVTTLADPNFNSWYVRPNTGEYGLENGTSWANAFDGFADIAWASVEAGDYIYVSGGSTSATYNEQLAPECQATATNRVTIIAGKYSPSPSGHSGTPIITGGVLFNEYGANVNPQYITIKGFEITGSGSQIKFDADISTWMKAIIIDSVYLHDYGNNKGIEVLGYVDSLIIRNSIIIDCLTLTCEDETDCIHIANGGVHEPKRVFIHDNYIRSMSQDPLAHNDAIQSASCEGVVIYNNIVINDSVNSPQGGGIPGIISGNDLGNDDYPAVIVFNNLFYMGGVWYPDANQAWTYSVRLDQNGDTWAEIIPTYIFNNTIVSNGPRVRGLGNDGGFAHLIANNIIAQFCLPDNGTDWRTGATHGWMTTMGFGDIYTHEHIMDSIRTNLFWRQDSIYAASSEQQALITGNYIYSIGGSGGIDPDTPWDDWIAKGGTGLFRDPKLVTPYGNVSDQGTVLPDILSSSPAINAGEDLTYLYNLFLSEYDLDLPALLNDYYGNPRSDWDIGAVEYQP